MTINMFSFKMEDRTLFKDVLNIVNLNINRSKYEVGNSDMLIIFFEKADYNTMLTILSKEFPNSLYSIWDTNSLKIKNPID